ncbi:hypothetical protein KIN20_004118 [Parelaphostrongylus tenuis]|uniref:Uncharacterized protein n=1 Tax=Parelaphostrongylus tenuis TaxID=148309 RepID=A0AAD5QHU3_PARTN|nr:hypothetical protein KIN20_004118 [Parelaphostrongylus tenuis]
MVATASKRRLSSSTKIMKKPLATSNFKPKIVVKESDRIARMKAAREAYSKLSKDRSQKPSTSGVRTAPKKVVNEVSVETKEMNSVVTILLLHGGVRLHETLFSNL